MSSNFKHDPFHQVARIGKAFASPARLNSFLTVKDKLEPVPAGELLKRARAGLVTVLDVRPREEYAAGHLRGAINVPLAALEKHLDKLPTDKEVVAYCRGPHCVLAFDAVARLRKLGFKARRLEHGFPEWKLAGRWRRRSEASRKKYPVREGELVPIV